jgi:valyl-tRNA synthetase
LDTWFTSSLTPDINNNSDLNGKLKGQMYPMSMRPQAHDIIRTWGVYSILMGLYRHQEVPWNDLMLSGHILVKKGEKISKKSGGGQFKPEDLISRNSADAIRYAMCGASLGRDAYYDESEVDKGKKLVTKIYNAGKLTITNLKDYQPEITEENDLEAVDLWILNRSRSVASKMATELDKYEFGRARQLFEDFFWREFCDNYLEIVKGRLQINDQELSSKQNSAKYALYHAYLNILKMTSIFTPHIAEEMYHAQLEKKDDADRLPVVSGEDNGFYKTIEGVKSITLLSWPTQKIEKINKEIESGAELMLFIISEVRKYKTKNNIKLKDKISTITCLTDKKEIIEPFIDDIKFVTKAEKLIFKKPDREDDSEKLKIEID